VPRSIYLDYNATTPLDAGVRMAMQPYLEEIWGNPSSVHHVGRRARAALDDFHARAAAVLSCKPSELIFTSGGTESNNLAIFGAARRLRKRGRHLITTAIEHHAVLNSFKRLASAEGFELTILPVDREGRISVELLSKEIRNDTILVSVMAANNEVGTLQPVAEIGTLCRQRGVTFHTDGVQWFGKEPFENIHQFEADLVSLGAHKFHGPKGAGALFIRSPLLVDSLLLGGGQENEHRAGTENLAGIAGLVTALEKFVSPPVFPRQKLAELTGYLSECIASIKGATLLGSRKSSLANTVSFLVEGTDSFALLAGLDVEGVCASAGSACSAGSLEPSHVVSALGYPDALSRSFVRFSLGRGTEAEEIRHVCELLPEVIRRSQGC
jgi:cysteine desulfurase